MRTQEAIIKILKMRKTITNAQLQSELVQLLRNMFVPSKKLIKEQVGSCGYTYIPFIRFLFKDSQVLCYKKFVKNSTDYWSSLCPSG